MNFTGVYAAESVAGLSEKNISCIGLQWKSFSFLLDVSFMYASVLLHVQNSGMWKSMQPKKIMFDDY